MMVNIGERALLEEYQESRKKTNENERKWKIQSNIHSNRLEKDENDDNNSDDDGDPYSHGTKSLI